MLITPILQKHDAFDATSVTYFYADIGSGGESFSKTKLVIKNNNTGTTVYTNEYSNTAGNTTSVKMELSANTLSNGVYYSAYVQTYNATSGYSAKSNSIQFNCFAQPTLTRSNYTNNETINASYKDFITVYNDASNEPLSFVRHIITNLTTNEIYKDETQYATTISVPYEIEYFVGGLLNENNYKYTIEFTTVNGMTGELETNFSSEYEIPTYDSALDLKNLCDFGVIKVSSKFKVINGKNNNGTFAIDGSDSYIHIPKTLNSLNYEGINNEPKVYWDKDSLLDIPCNQNSMTIMYWFRPETVNTHWKNVYFQSGVQSNGTCKYAHRLNFEYGLVPNTNTYANYIEYTVYNNMSGQYVGTYRSNYVTDLGTTDDKYYVYFSRNDTTIDLRLAKLTDNGDSVWGMTTQNSTSGNLTRHMYWNLLNNYLGTSELAQTTSYTPSIGSLLNETVIHSITLYNGNYYNLTIYNGVQEYNETPPTDFTDNMIFNCAFNNNLQAGNFDVGTEVDTIFIKKRTVGSNKWLPIYHSAKTSSAFDLEVYDPYCANGVMYTYAIVPCKTENGHYIEGNYITKNVLSTFDGFVVADSTNIFKGMVNINYDATDSAEYGLLQPLNKKYPIVIHNGITRYNKGTLNCAIMGYSYMSTRKLNTKDIALMRNDVVDFLNNGNVKVVKAWTGDIIVIQKIGDVTRAINSQTGYSSIGFSWVEQGHIDDVDLYENYTLQAISSTPDFIVKTNEPERYCVCCNDEPSDYVTESELNDILLSYVTNTNLESALTGYQTKTLSTPIKVNGTEKTTVETTLNGLNNTFTGTRAEWNALTQADRDLYENVYITDDTIV